MKRLLLIAITALTIVACETTTEPKDVNVSVNEAKSEVIYCKRVWPNESTFSYSTYKSYDAYIVDSIKVSKGFGNFAIEYYADSIWTMRTATSVKYIRL